MQAHNFLSQQVKLLYLSLDQASESVFPKTSWDSEKGKPFPHGNVHNNLLSVSFENGRKLQKVWDFFPLIFVFHTVRGTCTAREQ